MPLIHQRQIGREAPMKSQIVGLHVAAIVFGLIALAQVARLVIRAEIMVSGHHVPLWPSAIAAVVFGGLCIALLAASLRKPQ